MTRERKRSFQSLSRRKGRSLQIETLEARNMLSGVPNDPLFSAQWALQNTGQDGGTPGADIDIVRAWDEFGTGDTSVVIAVNDSGTDYTHPDLYKNIWLNQGEIPANIRSTLVDVDSDGLITFWDLNDPAQPSNQYLSDINFNGYIDAGDLLDTTSTDTAWEDGIDADGNNRDDDLVGWDFIDDDNDPFLSQPQPGDQSDHGTRVAGVMLAQHNNGLGIAGVASQSQLLLNRIKPSTQPQTGLDALSYVADLRVDGVNVRISNNSWVVPDNQTHNGEQGVEIFREAIQQHESLGILFIAAAGNVAEDLDNLEEPLLITHATTPGILNLNNIINVAASDRQEQLSVFSSFGATSVDLAAPGSDILTTFPLSHINPNDNETNNDSLYSEASGTSFAAPMVAATAGIAWGRFSAAKMSEIRTAILSGVEQFTSYQGKVVTNGRLNAYESLLYLQNTLPPRVMSVAISGPNQLDGLNGSHQISSGSGDQLLTVPVGGANQVSITFSEGVDFIPTGLLELTDVNSSSSIPVDWVGYDATTFTATWELSSGAFGAQQVELKLDDAIYDADLHRLDGEWVNPTHVDDTYDPLTDPPQDFISTFPSGDGAAGGDFEFYFTVLPGDIDGDNIANSATDGWILFVNLGQGDRYVEGDLDGDQDVDSTDADILDGPGGTNGTDFRQWPAPQSASATTFGSPTERALAATDVAFDEFGLEDTLAVEWQRLQRVA